MGMTAYIYKAPWRQFSKEKLHLNPRWNTFKRKGTKKRISVLEMLLARVGEVVQRGGIRGVE